MKTREQAEAVLGADLSRAHVKTNPRGMAYVDGHYAVTKLNEAFGPMGWDLTVDRLECTTDGFYDDPNPKKAGQFRIGYMAVVTVSASVGAYEEFERVTKTDVGHGSGIGRDRADVVEGAVKEAVTDALKRAARHLGPSMGLALYDKNQADVRSAEGVDDILQLCRSGRLGEAADAIRRLDADDERRQEAISAYNDAKSNL